MPWVTLFHDFRGSTTKVFRVESNLCFYTHNVCDITGTLHKLPASGASFEAYYRTPCFETTDASMGEQRSSFGDIFNILTCLKHCITYCYVLARNMSFVVEYKVKRLHVAFCF